MTFREMIEDMHARTGWKPSATRRGPDIWAHQVARGEDAASNFYWLIGRGYQRRSLVVRYDSRRCTDCGEGAVYTFVAEYPDEQAAGVESAHDLSRNPQVIGQAP